MAAALDPLGVIRRVNASASAAVSLAVQDPGGLPESGAITTLDATIVRGDPLVPGKAYRNVTVGAAEPHFVRTEITSALSYPSNPIVAFVQLSDLHCIDDQSPGRTEFLDEWDNPGPPHFHSWGTFPRVPGPRDALHADRQPDVLGDPQAQRQ